MLLSVVIILKPKCMPRGVKTLSSLERLVN